MKGSRLSEKKIPFKHIQCLHLLDQYRVFWGHIINCNVFILYIIFSFVHFIVLGWSEEQKKKKKKKTEKKHKEEKDVVFFLVVLID